MSDLARWRREYEAELAAFARRAAARLELDNYEQALERHEAAIRAHEEILDRHERAMAIPREDTDPGDEFEGLHEQLEERHALSRREHDQLRRTHRAVIAALRMLDRKS